MANQIHKYLILKELTINEFNSLILLLDIIIIAFIKFILC
jgi:hypothetical protein